MGAANSDVEGSGVKVNRFDHDAAFVGTGTRDFSARGHQHAAGNADPGDDSMLHILPSI